MTSELERLLNFYILAELDIPKPTYEYRFHPTAPKAISANVSQFRLDYWREKVSA